MARVRLIADEARTIPLIGRLIEVDEVFEVDDEVFASREWPDSTFEVVADLKAKTDKEVN